MTFVRLARRMALAGAIAALATTGLETLSAMNSAASSSAEPPISPAITISSVS